MPWCVQSHPGTDLSDLGRCPDDLGRCPDDLGRCLDDLGRCLDDLGICLDCFAASLHLSGFVELSHLSSPESSQARGKRGLFGGKRGLSGPLNPSSQRGTSDPGKREAVSAAGRWRAAAAGRWLTHNKRFIARNQNRVSLLNCIDNTALAR